MSCLRYKQYDTEEKGLWDSAEFDSSHFPLLAGYSGASSVASLNLSFFTNKMKLALPNSRHCCQNNEIYNHCPWTCNLVA